MDQVELFEEDRLKDLNDSGDFYLADPELPGKTDIMPHMAQLYELSVDAFYAALYARMSELPIQKEITRFIEKAAREKNRAAAARAASDRGDPDVLVVQRAAYKVQHEIHRLAGLLRFNPDRNGTYIARCSPDHFILPALAGHFTLRFGETPWAIIDEKRRLCLCRKAGCMVQLVPAGSGSTTDFQSADNGTGDQDPRDQDPWEDLWRLYHRSINNEARNNPSLQRQFMPGRYQKYLPELR